MSYAQIDEHSRILVLVGRRVEHHIGPVVGMDTAGMEVVDTERFGRRVQLEEVGCTTAGRIVAAEGMEIAMMDTAVDSKGKSYTVTELSTAFDLSRCQCRILGNFERQEFKIRSPRSVVKPAAL